MKFRPSLEKLALTSKGSALSPDGCISTFMPPLCLSAGMLGPSFPEGFRLSFPTRTNYMYAVVERPVPELRAFTFCMWLRPTEGGIGTPLSYAVPAQPNELVLLQGLHTPTELLVDDKVLPRFRLLGVRYLGQLKNLVKPAKVMCEYHLIYRAFVSDLIQRRVICMSKDKVYILQGCEAQSNSCIVQFSASSWDSAVYETH